MGKIIVRGIVIPGLGAAKGTVPLQIPFIKKIEPNIETCFPATINIWLEKPLFVASFRLNTGLVRWSDRYHPEEFSILRVSMRFPEGPEEWRHAWVYKASNSPHQFTPNKLEILAPDLRDSVRPGKSVEINLPDSCQDFGLAIIG